MISRVLCATAIWIASSVPLMAQSDRVVALVLSAGETSARADAIQAQLQVIGAETLRAADPNNAELRAILKRFAAVAVNTQASLVYLDMPAVLFEGRAFVPHGDATIKRATDVLTQAVPLSAFARAAALSGQGGAVIIAVGRTPDDLPTELSDVTQAPAPLVGASPVLVAPYGNSDAVLQVLNTLAGQDVVDLGVVLQQMSADEAVTVSNIPTEPIYLKSPPEAEVEAVVPVARDETPDTPETEEELKVLEQSLSRSAKRELQNSLRDQGHYKGLVDGIFGPQTRQAIVEFQTSRLEEPTGLLTRRQLLDLR